MRSDLGFYLIDHRLIALAMLTVLAAACEIGYRDSRVCLYLAANAGVYCSRRFFWRFGHAGKSKRLAKKRPSTSSS